MINPLEVLGGVASGAVVFAALYTVFRDRSKDQSQLTREQREQQEKDDDVTARALADLKRRQDRFDRELMGEGAEGVWGSTKGFIPQQRKHNDDTDRKLKAIGEDAKAAKQGVEDLTTTLQPVINEFGRNGGSTWSDAMAMIGELVQEKKAKNTGSTSTGG